jgi:hypothetical protein
LEQPLIVHVRPPSRSTNGQEFIAFDHLTPLSAETGSTLDAQMAGRPKPFGHQRFAANGWSIYGAQRAQPVATSGKWDALENPSNRPIRNQWQPTATVSQRW